MIVGWLIDWPASRIVLLGFAVSLSSTAVAIKMLQDANELHTKLGRTTVGILIAQDIAVVPMMLIVGLMNGDAFRFTDVLKIVLAIGFMAGVIYFMSRKPKWFSQWVEAIPFGSETAVIGLTICFSASALSGMLGLSPGYGAFLAGLIIGNTSGSEKYEESVKPIFDVLIMVFFLSIGLLIDLAYVWENIWAILLVLVATMVLKTTANIAILRWQGVSTHQSFTMGASLGQIGEFSFILAALGLASGAIFADGYKFVVAIIALSLVMTPGWIFAMRRVPLLTRFRLMKRLAGRKKRIAPLPDETEAA
jgi:CPA2 family monovalent cation:H+ antiporter-2